MHTLPATDQQNLALADRALHKLVLSYRMAHDRRALETKPWISGPPVGSLELYRFNAAVWHALKTIVDSHGEWGSTPGTGIDKKLTDLIPVSRTQGFLEQLFLADYPQATKRVNRFLAQAYEHLMKHRKFPPQYELIPLAGDPTHGGERDLYRLYRYIANIRGSLKEIAFYAETDVNPDHWSYLKRYTTVKEKRDILNQPKPEGMDDKAWHNEARDAYEFIFSYGDQITAQEIRGAADANYRNQNYPRVVELREKLLAEYADQVTAQDIRWAAYANFNNQNYPRAVELREKVLAEYTDQVTVQDIRGAARANLLSQNDARAVELFEKVLAEYADQVTFQDIRVAAHANYMIRNYPRAVELFEKVLAEYTDQVTTQDVRRAARANLLSQNDARAVELIEKVLAEYADQVTFQDIRLAADANYRNQNYPRAVELIEKVLAEDADQVTFQDIRLAADANYHNQNYPRAVELIEKVLADYADQVTAQDIREAAAANLYNQNYARALELREKFFAEYGGQVTAQDIRWASFENFRTQNYPRAVELSEKVLAEYENEISANDYLMSYISNIAMGDFQRGDALREALFKKLDSSLESSHLGDLYTDMERYADRIQLLLDDGALSEDERRIYDSIFHNPEQDTLTAIETYVESSDTPDTFINRILLQAAVSLHLKAGNRDKAQEVARRF